MRHPASPFVNTTSSRPTLSILRPLNVRVVLLVAVTHATSLCRCTLGCERSVLVARANAMSSARCSRFVFGSRLRFTAFENDCVDIK
jgi:hypothetical protein